jgi:CBS domain-containing protein
VPEPNRAAKTVAQLVDGEGVGTLQVAADAPLESLLGNQDLRRLGALPAVDAQGRLLGVITAEQVGRALRDALGAP